MSRARKFFTCFGIVSILWLVSLSIVPSLAMVPIVALFAFGFYALGNIAFYMVNFKECPEAYKELCKETEVAKRDLREKKIID